MKLKTTVFCFALASFFQMNAQNVQLYYLDNTQPIEKRVESALSQMTLKEKVDMCHAQSKFSSKGVPRLGIPEVWMDDGPHGLREEVFWDEWSGAKWTNDSCTAFPALTCLAATFNPNMALLYGKSVGEEARYRNKTVLLGPGVNIYRTPMNGRNFEYMGEDPYLSSRIVVPYIQGVQQNGVSACVKHFALNNQELRRDHINVVVSDRALNEIYLPAFKAAVIEGKAWALMGSYNEYNGEHCCTNDLLLNQILKKDWKFDGVVISDWGGVHETDRAVRNGLDLEMGTSTDGITNNGGIPYSEYYLANPFLKGIESGKYTEAQLNEKVSRILRLIFRTTMSPNRPYGKFVSPEHSEAARKIAEEGIVLLKNEGHILPVPAGKYKRIAVIGENATRSVTIGGGSSSLKVQYEVSPLQGLIAKYGKENIVYSQGYFSGRVSRNKVKHPSVDADSLMAAAVETAKDADVVLYFGGLNKNLFQDSEGSDRKSYELPFGQDQLIEALLKVNKKVAVILISGNAVAMPWVSRVPAIVQNWYLGSEAGNAIAAVLSGEVNPSGKLPFSFPKKLEDNGAISFGKLSFPGDSINEYYKEDLLVGYRWFDTKHITPLFAFGYGLSYTTFEYGKISTDKAVYSPDEVIKVSFTLKNTGKTDGAEAVQVYASQPKASVVRPAKELKAFKKVFLKAGETQTVNMEINVKDLAFYNDKTKAWTVEPGQFILHNAASSADVKSSVTIQVK
jgi:beta-glucosidase